MTPEARPTLCNLALAAALCFLTVNQPAQVVPLAETWGFVLLLWAAYGWFRGLSAPADTHRWRRAQVLSSLGLALSLPVAIQVGHALLQPAIPLDALLLARRIVTQGATACWLPLVGGLSLLVLSHAAGMPRALSRVSTIAGMLLLVALAMWAGAWMLALTSIPPWWMGALGLLLLPALLRHVSHMVAFVFLGAACALLNLASEALTALPALQADLLLAGLLLGLPSWVAWAWHMNRIQEAENHLEAVSPADGEAFDLNAHLDSANAQEGADKYTRE